MEVSDDHGVTMFTPLLGRRGLKKKCDGVTGLLEGARGGQRATTPPHLPAKLETRDADQSDGSQESHAPVSAYPICPSPLLLAHPQLHSIKLRHSKPQGTSHAPLSQFRASWQLPTTNSHSLLAQPSASASRQLSTPPNKCTSGQTSSYSFSSPSDSLHSCHNNAMCTEGKWEEPKMPFVFSNPTPLAGGTDISNSISGAQFHENHLTRSRVFPRCDVVRRRLPAMVQSPNLMESIWSEMALRHGKHALDKGHAHQSHTMPGHRNKVKGVHPRQKQYITAAVRSRKVGSHYTHSATLGIELPRKKLRESSGVAMDMVSPGVGLEAESGEEEAPSSPIVLSASLGITGLRRAKARPSKHKSRGAHKVTYTSTRTLKENTSLEQSHDLTDTPPPPIVSILEFNKKSRGNLDLPTVTSTTPTCDATTTTTTTAQTTPTSDVTSITSTSSSTYAIRREEPENLTTPLDPPPLCTLQAPAQTHPLNQRFRPPWRWTSTSGRFKYTPVKAKGSISK